MAIEHRKRYVLILDKDESFLKSIQSDPKSELIPLLVCQNSKSAQLLIGDKKNGFAGAFVNPSINSAEALSVVRMMHQMHPATPIFFIYDNVIPFTSSDLKYLPVQDVIQKPISYSKMLNIVAPIAELFDATTALDQGEKNLDPLNVELTAEDSGFLPIRATDFVSGAKSLFDVYVRMQSGRYIKILKSGDSFSPDRVVNYLKKGVTHFYLRKEVQVVYLKYCDLITENLLKKDVPIQVKISQTLNVGEETVSFLKNQGLSEAHLHFATNFTRNVQTLVKQIRIDHVGPIKEFLNNIVSYEHGVSTTILASLLANHFKILTDRPVQIVGLASLLHDVGLALVLPSEFWDEDEFKMNDAQKKLYYTHPTAGAELLSKVGGIDSVVIQSIAQHHERRNKKGFPLKLGAGQINRISEIVGIADEFNKLILRIKKEPELDLLKTLETTVFSGFSGIVVESFKLIYFPNEQKNPSA